jgi:hypothetical protein
VDTEDIVKYFGDGHKPFGAEGPKSIFILFPQIPYMLVTTKGEVVYVSDHYIGTHIIVAVCTDERRDSGHYYVGKFDVFNKNYLDAVLQHAVPRVQTHGGFRGL